MFNNEKLEELEARIKHIEKYSTKFYIELEPYSITFILQLILDHLKLRVIAIPPCLKLEEKIDEKA